MWRLIQQNNPVWNFDATGTVIQNIKKQKKPLLYSLVVHDNLQKQIIPVAEFITTSHSINSIVSYLIMIKNILEQNISLKTSYVVAPIIVVDHSWALIGAVLRAFNNTSVLMYLFIVFDIIVKKENKEVGMVLTKIYICSTHMLKIIITKTKNVSGSKKAKNALIFSFTLLQNSTTLESFDLILENIYNIFNRKFISSITIESIKFIKNEMSQRELKHYYDFYENENLYENNFEKYQKIVHQENINPSVKKASPFSMYYNDLITKFSKKDNNSTKDLNDFYNPELFKIIQNKLYLMPFWTGLLFKKTHNLLNNVTRLTNNPVENWFNNVKNKILKTNKVMPSELVGSLYNRLFSKFIQFYMQKAESLTSNISNNYQETWKDKKTNTKRNNTNGYYKQSSIFGISTGLVQPSKENLDKCFQIGFSLLF